MQEGKPGDQYLYILTALYRESLFQWYQWYKTKPLYEEEYRKVFETECMKQLSSAMWHCHKKNIIHGDLKPENIFVVNKKENSKLHLVIGDFGIANGTEAFMSPEQRKVTECLLELSRYNERHIELKEKELMLRNKITTATDVFSMGLVFFEFILKIEKDDGGELLLGALQNDNTSMERGLYPDTAPKEFCQLIKEMTEPKPSERPSFEDILITLNSVE